MLLKEKPPSFIASFYFTQRCHISCIEGSWIGAEMEISDNEFNDLIEN